MDRIHVHDDSGDRKYFTMIPNYIANHSTANDQALYLQMKKHAGEDGECFVSEKTLQEKLGIGRYALQTSFKYLLSHNWIKYIGLKDVNTAGGVQKVKSYKMVDIWKLNVNEYEKDKGMLIQTPPIPKGVVKLAQGVAETAQRGANSNDKEEPFNKNSEEENTLSLKRKELVKKYKPEFLKEKP
jgi:hypothetical protein